MNVIELKSNQPLYTLGLAARLSGIPAHSIRQYIDKGLIIPFKLDSKRHLFSRDAIIRLTQINEQLDRQGLNIAGTKALMAQIPCWEASEKNRACKNENNSDRDVYQVAAKNPDVKSLLKTLL